jgi:hypothetical protein
VRPEVRIELVEHDTRLHGHRARGRVKLDDPVEMLRVIDDERCAHGLAALRGAAAARQNRHAFLDGDAESRERVFLAPRHHHADRLDLVDRRVGCVAPARCRVEQHVAPHLSLQTSGEGRITGSDLAHDGSRDEG